MSQYTRRSITLNCFVLAGIAVLFLTNVITIVNK